jgi:signal transduction histidine kinase
MDLINNDFLVQWFVNISLLMMLLLLYIFIPDRYVINKKIPFSVMVGIIFSFAAIVPTMLDWSVSYHYNVGLNSILIPLAGFFGGPLSGGIISVVILAFTIVFGGGEGVFHQIIIVFLSFLIGSLFYYLHQGRMFRVSPTGMIIGLSLFTGLIPSLVLMVIQPHPPSWMGEGNKTAEIALLVAVGVFLLGSIILFIDRKRDNDYELIVYKEHLEALVQERTLDLERMNALHHSTLESTTDGIVVVNFNGFIQSYNSAAAKVLRLDPDHIMKEPLNIHDILYTLIKKSGSSDIDPDNQLRDLESVADITFQTGEVYEIRKTPHLLSGKTIGNVFNLRNITKRRHAEDALQAVNRKLVLLSGITRHDILNQLTALKLYLDMLLSEVKEREIIDHVKKVNQISEVIQLQVEFTRDYQDLGLNAPAWLDLKDTFIRSTRVFEDQKVAFSFSGINYEIYSDPLLERVFFNLIDNSLRHGEYVTAIRVTTELENTGLIVRYSDDGVGVETRDKLQIFEKGFGKHTGFGMFLINEILSITGIGISETGTYGRGVQFDITVPAGKFREFAPV